jgi:hypothetical protein
MLLTQNGRGAPCEVSWFPASLLYDALGFFAVGLIGSQRFLVAFATASANKFWYSTLATERRSLYKYGRAQNAVRIFVSVCELGVFLPTPCFVCKHASTSCVNDPAPVRGLKTGDSATPDLQLPRLWACFYQLCDRCIKFFPNHRP